MGLWSELREAHSGGPFDRLFKTRDPTSPYCSHQHHSQYRAALAYQEAIFGQFWPPTLVTHPATLKITSHISDTPIFSNPSTKNPDKNPLYNSLNCSWGFLSGEFCYGVFSLEGLARGGFCPFPFCQNTSVTTELNITLNFRFHMYDNKISKFDVTGSWPPPSVTNCHTSDPLMNPFPQLQP